MRTAGGLGAKLADLLVECEATAFAVQLRGFKHFPDARSAGSGLKLQLGWRLT